MALNDPATILFLIGISMAAAGSAVTLTGLLSRRGKGPSHVMLRGLDLPCRYEFRDGYLISDLDGSDPFVSDPTDRIAAWGELRESLGTLNPEAPQRMDLLRAQGDAFVLIGQIGEDELSISGRLAKGRSVITVATLEAGKDRRMIDTAGLNALEAEADLLRRATDLGDAVLWQEDETGEVTWANARYFHLLGQQDPEADAMVWPIRRVFGLATDSAEPPDPDRVQRLSLDLSDADRPLWFDHRAVPHGRGLLHIAKPIDRLVGAEISLRDFVQTLSRTFAHLPIGLAIFDKHRQLILFNPALVTLSTLPTDWLSLRPDLFSFLDRLREKQRMPEPKDYQAWRASLGELERAAQDGSYQEMWTLPNGQTFRVIGRPHADGGVAFLFEDISQEVTLTRKFRGDLDLYQSVMDSTPEALAVFSKDGRMVLANAAYAAMWPDPAGTVTEASRQWQASCEPTPVWGEIRDFIGGYTARTTWSERLLMSDGQALCCRLAPLKGGASLVGFARHPVPVAGAMAEDPSALSTAT